jgi:hypothetical protein
MESRKQKEREGEEKGWASNISFKGTLLVTVTSFY